MLAWFVGEAVAIRTHATVNYGRVIHEFDPWFNYRATEYLSDNGWHAVRVAQPRCALPRSLYWHALLGWERSMKHATHNTQHSTQHTTRNTHNTQHTTRNTQHATRNTQHATRNTVRAAALQRAQRGFRIYFKIQ